MELTEPMLVAISSIVVAVCGVLTVWIRGMPPRERRKPSPVVNQDEAVIATAAELESLRRTISYQNDQMVAMRDELSALSKDVRDLRKALRMHSHETHLYRSAVSDCVTQFPETGRFWGERREVINGAVIAKAEG